ncbi:MAG: protoporphyrinogen oxidase [Bacteroidales bacterium]|nr:protoporphyrinogen oxidase [Bacteroidales bacterium]
MTIKTDIIIIGAGLTGLTLAFYLKKAGKNVLIIEKNDIVGGVIQTHEHDGFIYETGPNTGVLSNPELVQLFDDLKNDCELETANKASKQRWILKKGKWNALPSGAFSAIKTPLFSFKDKLKILGEPFRKKGTNPNETVAELVKRRMGKSFLDYAVDPFISGIYAGDPNKLVTKFALPKLYNLEQNYGSFIKGSIKKAKLPKTQLEKRATKEVFSTKGGLKNLISALEKNIEQKNIYKNCNNVTIEKSNNSFNTIFEHKDHNINIISKKIITTVGAYALPEILSFIDKKTLEPITNLEYAKVILTVAGYKNWKGIGLPAFGGLVPTVEKRNVLGILFPSSIFKNRTPEKGVILSVFMGGIKRPDLFEKSDNEIKQIAIEEINSTLNLDNIQPDFINIYKYQHAIPQYDEKSKKRFELISQLEKQHEGLLLAGNIRNGIGMADRVKQAVDIANSII